MGERVRRKRKLRVLIGVPESSQEDVGSTVDRRSREAVSNAYIRGALEMSGAGLVSSTMAGSPPAPL
ncbi:hypothetical protein JZ751_016518 [Albula glossodonta]|uniref:Uncharacterized protein n=1 Tax=Albula glossodonta TaxID=121402 RepID=A0A8T2NQ64_9TELE|nr:hypothetical protein JZ751_016518 [Albula glossodonta]